MVASAAKRIADDLGIRKSGEAFTAGLLHDLGISVVQKYFSDDFQKINNLVEDQQMRFVNAEEKILGISHQEIGKYLIEKWNLPAGLGEAILYHHQPSLAEEERKLCAVVHLADYMTQRFQIGSFNWDESIPLDLGVIDILQLGDENYLENLIESYHELFKVNLESLNL